MKNQQHSTSDIQRSTPKSTPNIEHRTPKVEDCALHERTYDLEERLLQFASVVIDLAESLPHSRAANHVGAQILRAGTAPFPSHGEAEAAESREDFIHKLKMGLKELRETRRWARLIELKKWAKNAAALDFVLK